MITKNGHNSFCSELYLQEKTLFYSISWFCMPIKVKNLFVICYYKFSVIEQQNYKIKNKNEHWAIALTR